MKNICTSLHYLRCAPRTAHALISWAGWIKQRCCYGFVRLLPSIHPNTLFLHPSVRFHGTRAEADSPSSPTNGEALTFPRNELMRRIFPSPRPSASSRPRAHISSSASRDVPTTKVVHAAQVLENWKHFRVLCIPFSEPQEFP